MWRIVTMTEQPQTQPMSLREAYEEAVKGVVGLTGIHLAAMAAVGLVHRYARGGSSVGVVKYLAGAVVLTNLAIVRPAAKEMVEDEAHVWSLQKCLRECETGRSIAWPPPERKPADGNTLATINIVVEGKATFESVKEKAEEMMAGARESLGETGAPGGMVTVYEEIVDGVRTKHEQVYMPYMQVDVNVVSDDGNRRFSDRFLREINNNTK